MRLFAGSVARRESLHGCWADPGSSRVLFDGTRGHGTLDPALQRSVARAGRPKPCRPYSERHYRLPWADDGEIDFLKIDVEGWEAEVIASGDWIRHRPRVLVIEAVTTAANPPTKHGSNFAGCWLPSRHVRWPEPVLLP